MTILASEIKKIHEEDISANGTVSEGFFKTLAATLNGVVDNYMWPIGSKQESCLTEAQFATQNGYSASLPEEQKRWVLMKGQSIVGSKLHALTGITTLPNAVANGAHSEQAKAGAATLQYFQNQNKDHAHSDSGTVTITGATVQYQAYPPGAGGTPNYSPGTGLGATTTSRNGGDVARPNSVTFNFFIKIND